MKTPKVAIITSTFNQLELLQKCLNSLKKKTDYSNFKVFVIDDSGLGEIGNSIKKEFKWVDVIINKENLGFSKSNNRGIKIAIENYNPDYFLLLSDDTEIIEKNWLKKMVEVSESDKKIGIVGCKVIYPDGSLQWFFSNGKIHFDRVNKKLKDEKSTEVIKEVGDVIGACFLIKKEVIEKIGLLDEKFSPAYGEDTDFCYRARKKGFKLFYVGTVKIIHYGSRSTKTVFNIWFIKKRNAIRLEWLNFGLIKILKYTFIHLGSSILSDHPFKKLELLAKAYRENIANFKEISEKRKDRNKND
jgi:GT2 family glycosyltransferase